MAKHHTALPRNTLRQCRIAGQRAFTQGAPITDNPCNRITYGYGEWTHGWLERCRDKNGSDASTAALKTLWAHEAAADAAHAAAFKAKWNANNPDAPMVD